MTPNTIEFKTTSNTLMDGWVMRITADRRIEVNEDVDVNEAAKKVLEAMQLMLDNQKRTWEGLTADEMLECLKSVDVTTAVSLLMSQYEMPPTFKVYAEAIEAKLKEKNT
jgi:hypothetical protein